MQQTKRSKKQLIQRIAGPAMFLLALLMLVGCIATTVPDNETTKPSAAATDASAAVELLTAPPTEPPLPPVTWLTFPPERELTASAYFVYDLDEERFLRCMGAPDDPVFPASITKLFTAYVALQYIAPGDTITVGEELLLLDPDSSVAGLQPGMKVTGEKLIAAMLLPSGNDAAYTTAAGVGRIIAEDSRLDAAAAVKVFMEEMNTQTHLVGMMDTNFVTPDGIHDDYHRTTFQDLVILGRLALENELIAKYARTAEEPYTPAEGEPRTWKNTNPMVRPGSDYYCPYALGLKTGQTDMAGSCLLSAFECNGRRLLIGVFGSENYDTRAADSLQLFNEVMGFEYQPPEPTEGGTTPTE